MVSLLCFLRIIKKIMNNSGTYSSYLSWQARAGEQGESGELRSKGLMKVFDVEQDCRVPGEIS